MDCRAFGRMAENINKFFSKGKPIFMEGRLTYDTWTAQDGTKRSRHRVTVENFQFLGGGGGAGRGGARAESSAGGPPPGDAEAPPPEDPDIPF